MVKKKTEKAKNNNKTIAAVSIAFVAVFIILFITISFGNLNKKTASNNSQGQPAADIPSGVDLKIPKSEVTEVAKFYPYKVDNVYMEVLAVKSNDGTIRTALNTCQVCYSSGRGYYVQKGDTLVCQNCGNVFRIDQVEKIKGGCNPVPATGEVKTDDGTNIVISKTFMSESKDFFLKWRR